MQVSMDFSILIGLVTLVVLEIVLGMDNLLFITILADKLPPKEGNRARLIGLSLALIIRLLLLSVILWMTTLTKPLFSIVNLTFSGHNLIMLVGGIFLLFKATIELYERLENRQYNIKKKENYANFWVIVLQIVVLDTIFSLDAIITASGIVNHVSVIIAATIIAMIMMLLTLKHLTKLIRQYPTVVVLCLSFLLVLGLSLVLESFNFHISKKYLYVAISFSMLVELFNQIARHNLSKQKSDFSIKNSYFTTNVTLPVIEKTDQSNIDIQQNINGYSLIIGSKSTFVKENYEIKNILPLLPQSLYSIVVISHKKIIKQFNTNFYVPEEVFYQLLLLPYSSFPISFEKDIIKIMNIKEILAFLKEKKNGKTFVTQISSTLTETEILNLFNKTERDIILITDKFDIIRNLILYL